jgi:SSS family solute:Na+ symporter
LAPFPGTETPIYIALTAFLLNLIVVVVLTPILRALNVADGEDSTVASDYSVDAGDEGVVEELSSTTEVR